MKRLALSLLLALPLALAAHAQEPAAQPEQVVFENFNSGFGKWQTSGTAFSAMSWKNPDLFPDDDSLPFRGEIVGIEGQGFVNTNNLRDRLKATGKAISQDFTIKLPYIHLKVGGHKLPDEVGVRLVVDGKAVRATTGFGAKENNYNGFHKLKHVTWDVREFAGKTGHLEIYDDSATAFVMVDSIVFSGDQEPQYLDVPNVVKIDPEVQVWVEGALKDDLLNCGSPAEACCIVAHGQIVAQVAAGERKLGSGVLVQLGDAFQIGSVSKTVTATLAAVMVEEGVIGWDTTVADVFPELVPEGNPYRDVTVLQLLTHTSGAPIDLAPFPQDPTSTSAQRLRAVIQRFAKAPPLSRPGETYVYGGGPTAVAAMLVQRTGLDYERLLQQYLARPLGLAHTSSNAVPDAEGDLDVALVWQHRVNDGKLSPDGPTGFQEPVDIHRATGSVNMCIADQGKLIISHMPDGRGPRLLTNRSLQMLHTPVLKSTEMVGDPAPGLFANAWPRWSVLGPVFHHAGTNGANLTHTVIVPSGGFGFSICQNTGGPPQGANPTQLESGIISLMLRFRTEN